MDADSPSRPRRSHASRPLASNWRTEILVAVLRQGPAFMILVLILYGLWHLSTYLVTVGVPAHLAEIKAGYREVQQSHTENLERIVVAFEREQARSAGVLSVLESLVENHELLADNNQLLKQIIRELQTLKNPSEIRRPADEQL